MVYPVVAIFMRMSILPGILYATFVFDDFPNYEMKPLFWKNVYILMYTLKVLYTGHWDFAHHLMF